MALGAGCVLLLAGGFPLLGAPDVYRGGAMLCLGILTLLVSLFGAYSIARGQAIRMTLGMIFLFFAVIGVIMAWRFIAQGIEFIQTGGIMWMGAIAMFCTAVSGFIFLAVFGYLVKRLMTRRLWLAGLHLSVAVLTLGAYIDYVGEEKTELIIPADGQTVVDSVTLKNGEKRALDFSLRIDQFDVSYYDNATYAIYAMDKGRASKPQQVRREGDMLVAGDEKWPVSSLRTAPGMQQPFLLLEGEPMRVLLQHAPAVREYHASCFIKTTHRGRPEQRKASLRVNEPLDCKGWLITLMDYRQSQGKTYVRMQARKAPGRIAALSGMVGVMICSVFWCWWKKEEEEQA